MGDRTKIQLAADRRSLNARRALGLASRMNREDQGVGQRALAAAAGIDPGHLARIQTGVTGASLEVLERVAAALGGEMSVRFYPGAGTALRDRYQAAIAEALLRCLHPAWKPS